MERISLGTSWPDLQRTSRMTTLEWVTDNWRFGLVQVIIISLPATLLLEMSTLFRISTSQAEMTSKVSGHSSTSLTASNLEEQSDLPNSETAMFRGSSQMQSIQGQII